MITCDCSSSKTSPKVGGALKEGLEAEGYAVTLSATGEDSFFLATSQIFDLIVLDVMLPGRNGLEILSALRKHSLHVGLAPHSQGCG
jgi:two-component system, OmpR family, copper resistance phosphate regulon response regulator CusR